jgi:hypothetical protein
LSFIYDKKGHHMTKTNAHIPAPGWWAVPQNIGSDRRWAAIANPADVLPALGLYIAAQGYCIAFETETITMQELSRHIIIGAADTESVLAVAKTLLDAGLWVEIPGVGIDCDAAQHIAAKTDRIDKARAAVAARIAKRERERVEALELLSQEEN